MNKMSVLSGNNYYESFYERMIKGGTLHLGWMKEMLNVLVHINPLSFTYVPEFLKTHEMCNKAVDWPWLLKHVPDQFKTKEMCDAAVERYPSSLWFVPD